MSVSEWRAWSRTVSVFLVLNSPPPNVRHDRPPKIVLDEVGVNWPWHPPASRTESKPVVPGSASAGRSFYRGGTALSQAVLLEGDLGLSSKLSRGAKWTEGVRRRRDWRSAFGAPGSIMIPRRRRTRLG